MPLTKATNLILILGTHTVGGENQLVQIVL